MYAVLALGGFEFLSNAYHLSKGSITAAGRSAKRQHREIPLDLDDIHFFIKALIMLGFGVLFLLSGILFALNLDQGARFGRICFALFGAYGLIQAIAYRRTARVWPAALVYSVPMVAWLIVR
jgi:hypothetical protein